MVSKVRIAALAVVMWRVLSPFGVAPFMPIRQQAIAAWKADIAPAQYIISISSRGYMPLMADSVAYMRRFRAGASSSGSCGRVRMRDRTVSSTNSGLIGPSGRNNASR